MGKFKPIDSSKMRLKDGKFYYGPNDDDWVTFSKGFGFDVKRAWLGKDDLIILEADGLLAEFQRDGAKLIFLREIN